ncbi:hypothetical protein ACP4OV_018125 [Aristida adscensionis]
MSVFREATIRATHFPHPPPVLSGGFWVPATRRISRPV